MILATAASREQHKIATKYFAKLFLDQVNVSDPFSTNNSDIKTE